METVAMTCVGIPCSMGGAALFHDHRHDSVFVGLPALLVYSDNLVYPHVTDEITHDEDKIRCDDTVRVDVAHSVARRECLLRGDDWNNLDTGRWF